MVYVSLIFFRENLCIIIHFGCRREKAALDIQELRVSQSDTVSGNLEATPPTTRSTSDESLNSDEFTHL